VILLGVAAAGAVALAVVSSSGRTPEPAPAPQAAVASAAAAVHRFEVVREFPHDPEAFTQGLIYRDGFLYESTGLNGRSSLRKVELETGKVLQRRAIDEQYFGEGLTDWGSRLIQLTWQTNVGFVYDLATFAPQSTFEYPGQGWGLTHDDRRLIMSDGSADLRFLDPSTQRELGRLRVHDRGAPVEYLNELELVDGQVYANVFQTDRVAVIDPASGRVTAWIDLSGLLRPSVRRGTEDVLNGIAYDAAGRRLFVTGKLWPRLFEIRLRPGTPS
jgi:glutamine cyclotransferase